MRDKVLRRIIKRVGSQKRVAEELGLRSQQTVSWWLKNGVPPKWVPDLVKLDAKYGGSTKPQQLRPDIFHVELRQ